MSILRTEVLPFKATAFKDGDFINISEADLHGKWSVVFFYPADFTFVCPTELEDLAEHYEEFQKRGVEIYSVSTDTHFTHMAWHGSSPAVGKVRFPMVGDPTGVICRNFGVMIEEAGLAEVHFRYPAGKLRKGDVDADDAGEVAPGILQLVRDGHHHLAGNGEIRRSQAGLVRGGSPAAIPFLGAEVVVGGDLHVVAAAGVAAVGIAHIDLKVVGVGASHAQEGLGERLRLGGEVALPVAAFLRIVHETREDVFGLGQSR